MSPRLGKHQLCLLADALEAGRLEQFFAPGFMRDRPRIYISGRARQK